MRDYLCLCCGEVIREEWLKYGQSKTGEDGSISCTCENKMRIGIRDSFIIIYAKDLDMVQEKHKEDESFYDLTY